MVNHIKKILKHFLNKEFKLHKKFKCSVCNSKQSSYIPLSDVYRLNAEKYGYRYFGKNEHLNIKSYSCSSCGAADRDRLYATYFEKFIDKNNKKTLLHVAPAWKLNDLFLKKHFDVTTTDLMMDGVDIYMDVENMKDIEDNSFDFFICSHVLEHVINPDKALNELYRILKPGGSGIIMAPIIAELKDTLEKPEHKSKAERIKFYGQEDHLRLFSKKDFIDRIEKANFKLKQLDINYFGSKTYKILGLNETSVLYVGRK